jgi:hypothetical protein
MALYAGQSVGIIHERHPAATVVEDMVSGAERIIARLADAED